jgi:iron complex transport system substrate-binding protein
MRETSPLTPSSTEAIWKGFSFAPRTAKAALLVTLVLAAAACSSGGSTPTPTSSPTSRPTATPTSSPTAKPTPAPTEPPAYPLVLEDAEGTEITLEAEPERVVSLTPATTELLFALGDGAKLVGRTDFDDYPPEAVEVPAVASFTGVVIEQVVDADPDLVIAGGNNFTSAEDVQRLRDLGMQVLVVYAEDLEGVLADIELVGQAVGSSAEAEGITASIQERIDEVTAASADLEKPLVFYEIGYGPEIYAPAPNFFLTDMIDLAGGEAVTTSDPAVFSVSLEQLVTADPEVIVLGDAAYAPPVCPDAVVEREGWDGITAVETGDIRPVNDVIVTRPGPRIGEGLAALALAIHPDAEIAPPQDEMPDLCAAT